MPQKLKLEEFKTDLIRMYRKGATVQQLVNWLHDEQGVHAALGTITNALDRWEVKRVDAKHKKHYPINHQALDDASDPLVKEWLRFLTEHADLGENVAIVSLPPSGLHKLLELREFLATTKPVEPPKDGRIRLRLYSKALWQRIYDAKRKVKV